MICRHSAFAFVKKPAEQKNTPEPSLIQGDRIMYSDVQNSYRFFVFTPAHRLRLQSRTKTGDILYATYTKGYDCIGSAYFAPDR